MSWREGRTRSVCKKIMFTPEEWERAKRLHEQWTKDSQDYRQWSVFARQMLMIGHVEVTAVQPITNPEPIAKAIDKVGVNVNQIAHWANVNEHISVEQVTQIRESFARIEHLLGELFAERRHTIQGK